VKSTIERHKPRFVLIEGPSDMNSRMDELSLGHTLPVAVFSYATTASGASASWSPFCDYSPEWVAVMAAKAAGARALFMDLPAWHRAFSEIKNRYADHHSRAGERQAALCERVGVEDSDALWDHLFEQPASAEDLAARLRAYFEGLRRDEPMSERDIEREAFMARWIAWAMEECRRAGGGDVVVVCGGFHAPALEALWQAVPAPAGENAEPTIESRDEPSGLTSGSYLVPYSFHRLDSFVGYEAGMPSPGFYQAVWDEGPHAAPETMLFRAIERLRKKKQLVSPADAIAASTAAQGLKALRGHAALARVDILDGLATALLKDALDAPLPWSRRGKLLARTDPMLVEIVAAFSGERTGKLAEGTPRPPLVRDAFDQIKAVGIDLQPASAAIEADLTDPRGLVRSRVLHRLRILDIPGFSRVRAPAWGRAGGSLSEAWVVQRMLDADAALIEAAAYGASLEAAAAGKLEELFVNAEDLSAVADLLFEAALAGIHDLGARLLADVQRAVLTEPSFGVLGRALATLLALYRHDSLLGARGSPDLAIVISAAFDRGLWLFEGMTGADAPLSQPDVEAVIALRDTLLAAPVTPASAGAPSVSRDRAEAVLRRRARDRDAPPSLRGAALGFLWSAGFFAEGAAAEAEAILSMRSSGRPEILGDYLVGLFALAREEVQTARALLAAADEVIAGMIEHDFLVAVPSLRLAFSFFPPREKERIAAEVLGLHNVAPQNARALLEELRVHPETIIRGRSLDRAAGITARRYGLDDPLDVEENHSKDGAAKDV
jgi:hypothetical protein